jgi:Fic family protein
MFKPKYTISHKLLANIKKIAALAAELNSRAYPKVVLMAMERTAREISSHSSTSIEGNPLPLTGVKKILKNRPANLRDSEKEVLNYNQALEDLNLAISKGKLSLDLKLILAIQKKIMNGLLAKYRCGQFRTEPVFVNDPRKRATIYWPPDQQEVEPLMTDLISFIHHNTSSVDPILLAGIFHKQFVVIHPFTDGNGRTARLATKVILAAMGINTFNLFSFENYYNRNVIRYFEKVGVFGNYYDIKEKLDFTDWLEYFTDGIIDELLRVGKELAAATVSPKTTLLSYHQTIINYIKEHGYITDKQYAGLTKRAKATRNLDFKKLISLGLIKKYDQGKATYYK